MIHVSILFHLNIHIVASSWLPVEFHAYSYGCIGNNQRTVGFEFCLNQFQPSGFQRFVQRENGFCIFAVYLGDDVVAPLCLAGWETYGIERIVSQV